MNVPIAALAIIGVRSGIAADAADDLHRAPADAAGAVLGTAAIVLALVAPTLFVEEGAGSGAPPHSPARRAEGRLCARVCNAREIHCDTSR